VFVCVCICVCISVCLCVSVSVSVCVLSLSLSLCVLSLLHMPETHHSHKQGMRTDLERYPNKQMDCLSCGGN
jgi:hypothetical protein